MLFNPIIKRNQYGFEYGDNLRNLSCSGNYFSALIKKFIKQNCHLNRGQIFVLANVLVLNVIAKIEAFLAKNPQLDSFHTLQKEKIEAFHGTIISFENLVEGFALEVISAVQMQRKTKSQENNLSIQPRM